MGPRGQQAAVNVDVSESDQATLTVEEFQQALARPPADEARIAQTRAVRLEQDQGLWRYGIAVLGLTGLSGLVLMLLRGTPAMGLTLAFHLGTVFALYATMPYSKFVHGLYRVGALVRYAMERRMATSRT